MSSPEANHSHDVRCLCGCLVARLVEGGVELKCKRCRRLVVVPLEDDQAAASSALKRSTS